MTEETKQNKTLVEEAMDVVSELKKTIEERKLLLEREEKVAAAMLLGGRSEITAPAPKIDPEAEAKNRVNDLLKATGLKAFK